MDVLAANAIIASTICRLAPDLADVLDEYVDASDPARPRVPEDRQRGFRLALMTRLSNGMCSTGEIESLAAAFWRVSDDRRSDTATWRNVVAALMPYSAVAALAGVPVDRKV